jgi:Tol biopolymer transport system component/DNA-binding winged helix-turn-helix (wHTH) protein
MESSAAGPDTVHFGVFEADLAEGELRKRGRKVPLQDQPFQVLAVLLRRRGEIVSREELQQALWPAETFVEFEHGVNTAINKLRQALGDSADNPRFIETLPRKGYRFIAPVSVPEPLTAEAPAAAAAPESTTAPAATPVAPPPRRRWVWGAAALISLSLVLAGVVWWSRWGREPRAQWEMVPFTNYPGVQAYPSFSPDGNQVVFAWTTDNWRSSQLYRKQVGSLLPVQLTTKPELDLSPAFSPDGTSIGFIRCQKEQRACAFATIPQTGGAERIVADLPAPGKSAMDAYEFYSHTIGPIFAWLPDGKHVVVDGLTLLNAQSGEQRPLTSPPPNVWPDFSPDVSPDGHTVVFARAANNEFRYYLLKADIHLLDLDADLRPKGEPRRLTFFEGLSYSPVWTPDGRRIIFVTAQGLGGGVERDLVPRLWAVRASGSAGPEQLFLSPMAVALSRAGNRLAFVPWMPMGLHVWRFSLSVSREAIGPPVRFVSSLPGENSPHYSPDGKRVAFEAVGERDAIWVGDADGSNLMEVYSHPPALVGTPRWAPDGERLAFDCSACSAGIKWRVYVIRAGGGKPVLLTPGPAGGAIPSWSADGKWVYFSSTVNRQSEIWKVPADGGAAVQVTRKGGLMAFESRDGKTLYYTKHDMDEVGALWKMPVSGGEEELVIPSVVGRNFAVAGTGVYFAESDGAQAVVRYLPFATGKVRTITPSLPGAGSLCVSPDERSLLVQFSAEHPSGLTLVENFRP